MNLNIEKLSYKSFISLIKDNFVHINKNNIDEKIELFDDLFLLFIKSCKQNEYNYDSHLIKIKSLLNKRASSLKKVKKLSDKDLIKNNTNLVLKAMEINLTNAFSLCTNYYDITYSYENKSIYIPGFYQKLTSFQVDIDKIYNKIIEILHLEDLNLSYLNLEQKIFIIYSLFIGRENKTDNNKFPLKMLSLFYALNKIEYEIIEVNNKQVNENMENYKKLYTGSNDKNLRLYFGNKLLDIASAYTISDYDKYHAYKMLHKNEIDFIYNYYKNNLSEEYITKYFDECLLAYKLLEELKVKNLYNCYSSVDDEKYFSHFVFKIKNIEDSVDLFINDIKEYLKDYIKENTKNKKLMRAYLNTEVNEPEFESLFNEKIFKQVKMEFKLKK